MVSRKVSVLVFLSLLVSGIANGQKARQIFLDTPGLQVGMYQGYTQFNDAGMNYYFRLYNQHSFKPNRFGEFSISSGLISGLGYRSQLTPIEYRFGHHLGKFGVPEPELFGVKSSFYTYIGGGLLYSRPLEVVAPNDPLTVEMGSGLPATSFWEFKGGFAPFIPVGAGLEIPLDQGSRLNISMGYNQVLGFLKFNNHDVPHGFWGFSIGINFRQPRVVIPRAPRKVMRTVQPLPIAPAELKPEPMKVTHSLLDLLNNRAIHFEILSSELNEQAQAWISEAASILKENPGRPLQVYGHASSTGTEDVNEMISESRARAVWLALVDEGVDPSRLNYSWYADKQPVESNETREGRFQNRRVNFRTVPPGAKFIEQPAKDELYIVPILRNYEFDKPFFEGLKINFSESMLGLNKASESYITVVSYLMILQPDIEVVVLNQVDGRAGEDLRTSLAKARADLIKAELIMKNIEPNRVHTATPGTALYEQYSKYLQGNGQQNLLIPVHPNSLNSKEVGQ